jgi:uncharacterized repeat protein (TIGR03803 family)
MKNPSISVRNFTISTFRIFALALLLSGVASAAGSERVIHNFVSGSGYSPWSSLVFDSAGNLYGTTQEGGSAACDAGCGTVFQLTPKTGGGWTYRVIHAFTGGHDGIYPTFSSGLVLDAAGNVYGTTWQGGAMGYGCVFEVSPNSDGSWTEAILHSFLGSPDGNSPEAGLAMDSAGNLYGTTAAGGTHGEGTVFEISPSGGWSEKILLNFDGKGGGGPITPVVVDSAGNLYGTANGGAGGDGMVFQLSPNSSGTWTETVLYSFTKSAQNGGNPQAGLLLDPSGNLYGTDAGTTQQNAAVFKLAPNGDGTWTESTIHTFSHVGDGSDPRSGLVEDSAGNLYGTTYVGGSHGAGTVYKLTPNANGGWDEHIVYSFTGGADGNAPLGGAILDQAGHIYGTTAAGGSGNGGVVFEIQQ